MTMVVSLKENIFMSVLVGLWPPTCGWWLATLARGVNDQWTQVLLTLILSTWMTLIDTIHQEIINAE